MSPTLCPTGNQTGVQRDQLAVLYPPLNQAAGDKKTSYMVYIVSAACLKPCHP